MRGTARSARGELAECSGDQNTFGREAERADTLRLPGRGLRGETATTSKEGSRRANYPILIQGGSDNK